MHLHSRRPHAQPAKRRPRPPPRPPRGDYRSQRVGQEFPGLRHALRRGAAAIHRKPVDLRPAIPPSTRTPRRRSHRGLAADDLRRSARRRTQSAEHGGHRHRSLRLFAAALRAAGRAPLLPLRRGHPPAIAGAGAGRPLVAGRGDADHGVGPVGPRPQGRAQGGLRGRAQGGVSPRGSTAWWSTSATRPPWCGRSRTISRR